MTNYFSVVNANINDVAGIETVHVTFEGQSASIFHGVKKYGRNFAGNTDAATAFVGNIG